MVRGILGKKVGMTQIYDDTGAVIPVTVVQAGPCIVVQRKTTDNDGYEAVQLGLVEPDRKPPRLSGKNKVPRALVQHFDKAGVPPTRFIAEVPVDADDEVKAGDAVLADIFAPADTVHVVGRSKGRGFQGVIKRHGHGGGRATHGSMFHRAPGSIGMAATPSRVLPGVKMPGQTGSKRVTVKNAKVVKVDAERNLVFLKGGVPGARNGYIRLVKAT
jgi:large subunit ribosomal protein L3